MYHGEQAAKESEEEFDRIFIKKEIPDEVPEFSLDNNQMNILDLIVKVNFAPSRGEAKRLVTQGGVSLNGEKISNIKTDLEIKNGSILKVGKRKFIKLTCS